MRKSKKVLSAVLAGVMSLSTVSGFGISVFADETKDDGFTTAAENGMELPEVEDGTLHITANIADFNKSSEGTQMQELWQEKMEEYLGVKLDITWQRTSWGDFRSKELVNLNGAEIGDVNTYSQGSAVNDYGDKGIVLNLSDYSDYIKYYWDYVDGMPNGRDVAVNPDGSMYYFMDGSYNDKDIQGAQSFTAFAYRFDALQANDLTPATTLEEFTKLCADLKALIDDGTIEADYVLANSTKDYAFYRGFTGIFHTDDNLYWNGNEWAFGPIEDNFREMLKYMKSLYDAGYIDPEFATADSNAVTEKATTGKFLISPTLWAGSANSWNSALPEGSDIEWGLAYLPTNEDYGTAWKWGSKYPGKSLNQQMGIYISADTEYPEYMVAMIDYQYSDAMVELLNWGIKDETYTVDADGNKTYSDEIMNDADPANKSADYGIMASAVCRSGIPFVPQDFRAVIDVAATSQPWWAADNGYYIGKYWVESDRIGGTDSVHPRDRAAVLQLDSDQSAAKAQLSSACEAYAKEEALKFIRGEYDIESDDDWNAYVDGVKSQTDEDFDSVIETLNENSYSDSEAK